METPSRQSLGPLPSDARPSDARRAPAEGGGSRGDSGEQSRAGRASLAPGGGGGQRGGPEDVLQTQRRGWTGGSHLDTTGFTGSDTPAFVSPPQPHRGRSHTFLRSCRATINSTKQMGLDWFPGAPSTSPSCIPARGRDGQAKRATGLPRPVSHQGRPSVEKDGRMETACSRVLRGMVAGFLAPRLPGSAVLR